MGVPAFYRWLSEKYPKIIQDVLEERIQVAEHGSNMRLPFDAKAPNPSGLECDALYIDMNGIIHPCCHPEHGPQPSSEPEMYDNVCRYVDRLVRAIRPRQTLYLAIDGVAPRAKMNQQRARRFRSAQEARELHELEESVRVELTKMGQQVPPTKPAWDSNVITPGTPFMLQLSEYLRFYIRKRISTDKAWQKLRVIFSDASVPGEGEHKIMSHIRLQRAQPGYQPNSVHVLHGLDADLIMLALATHEAHFYISREEVLFGRKSMEMQEQRQLESGFAERQKQIDEAAGAFAMALPENMGKPLQRVSIPILREYLANEFASCLQPGRLPFNPSLERLIDDVVFLCFFVGNDFLPHLPSLDIRDGALDFLFNVYKRVLPTLDDYITKSGGNVNLAHVDVILAEVGAIEDHVFAMKFQNEQQNEQRKLDMAERRKQGKRGEAPPPPLTNNASSVGAPVGRAAKILAKHEQREIKRSKHGEVDAGKIKVTHMNKDANIKAALALKQSFSGNGSADAFNRDDASDEVPAPSPETASTVNKRKRQDLEDAKIAVEENVAVDAVKTEIGIVGGADEEFDQDDGADYEEDMDADIVPDIDATIIVDDPAIAAAFKEKVKTEQNKKLDEYAKTVQDNVRLHEVGWKDRYYTDKCKADDVSAHGGREHLFRSYVVGLCWVMKYYYAGCASWRWYFPFHYAPFASDLKRIERFDKECKQFESSRPFNPVEQLMAVLPSDSSHAVPKEARWLMSDHESPIIDFYPQDVPVDPNGKAMPWLWVVLLPFIDEDRLVAALSATMPKWTPQELLCNARGLDDGYLYIHRNHPLSKKVATLSTGDKNTKANKLKLTDSSAYNSPGFSGAVRPPLSNEAYPTDEDIKITPPQSAVAIFEQLSDHDGLFVEALEPNDAVCVAFSEPPRLTHKSILLPGARPPAPCLSNDDRRIRRPRLNRGGGTIANLGMGSAGGNGQSHHAGYGSMNISSYERDLAARQGRGHQLNQAGTRTWGSLEPTMKRPPPMPNPMMQRQPQQQQQYAQNGYAAANGHRNQFPGTYHQGYHHQQAPTGYHAQPPQQQMQWSIRGGGQFLGPPQQHGGGYYPPQRGPPPQQNFSFRSQVQAPPHQLPGAGTRRPPQQASADVMSSLRTQLASTLQQQANKNRPGNQYGGGRR